MAQLVASIKEFGINAPILVLPADQGQSLNNKYEIVTGERRVRAAKQLGMTKIFALVLGNVGDDTAQQLSIIDNLQREDLSALEKGYAFASLKRKFGSTARVAEKICISKRTVERHIRLTSIFDLLPEAEALLQYKIEFKVAYKLAALLVKNSAHISENEQLRKQIVNLLCQGNVRETIALLKQSGQPAVLMVPKDESFYETDKAYVLKICVPKGSSPSRDDMERIHDCVEAFFNVVNDLYWGISPKKERLIGQTASKEETCLAGNNNGSNAERS